MRSVDILMMDTKWSKSVLVAVFVLLYKLCFPVSLIYLTSNLPWATLHVIYVSESDKTYLLTHFIVLQYTRRCNEIRSVL